MGNCYPLVTFLAFLFAVSIVRGIIDGRHNDRPFWYRSVVFVKNMSLTAALASIATLCAWGIMAVNGSVYSAVFALPLLVVMVVSGGLLIGSVGMMFGSVIVDEDDL